MICDEAPCVCNKKEKSPPRPRTPKSTVTVESPLVTTPAPVVQKPSPLAAMKKRAESATFVVTTAPVKQAEPEVQYRDAIKALWPILHPDEQAKIAREGIA